MEKGDIILSRKKNKTITQRVHKAGLKKLQDQNDPNIDYNYQW